MVHQAFTPMEHKIAYGVIALGVIYCVGLLYSVLKQSDDFSRGTGQGQGALDATIDGYNSIGV